MKQRTFWWSAAAGSVVLLVPTVRADVKTTEKTTFALEGPMGGLVRRFGGKAANEGVTRTVAVKGDRQSSISDVSGQIIDLGEEKVYTLDVRKKEYRVQTFAELRAEFEKDRAEAAKHESQARSDEKTPSKDSDKQMEFDVAVKNTDEKKTIAGYDTHEAIVTVTGHEKGQTLEESGGFVMTSDLWLGPRIPALDEVMQFDLKFARAVYGETFVADMQQMAGVMAMYPQFQAMAAQMQTQGGKLQGTPLSTTMTFEAVKSPEEMKESADESSSGGGGGLGGLLGHKLMGKPQPPSQRAKVMTTTHDLLSVETSVSAADVDMPAGYKEKK